METKSEHLRIKKYSQSGNALVYVLIAIALFAALSFTFVRRNTSENVSQVESSKAENFSTQLIAYTAQVKSVIDQMNITGTQYNQLDFTKPNEESFNSDPTIHKIYHPSGGGLNHYVLPKALSGGGFTPPAGIYLGIFNNVEWTTSSQEDIILSAYGILKSVCENLNKKLIGTTEIPVVDGQLEDYFVNSTYHGRSNETLDAADCPDCENKLTLCVTDQSSSRYVFYTIIIGR